MITLEDIKGLEKPKQVEGKIDKIFFPQEVADVEFYVKDEDYSIKRQVKYVGGVKTINKKLWIYFTDPYRNVNDEVPDKFVLFDSPIPFEHIKYYKTIANFSEL